MEEKIDHQKADLRDRDIREPLFAFLEDTYGRIRILEEKMMGRSRADVIMVLPDALAGIEIKSDADSYARLGRQVKDYDAYFDYNFVVVGTSHAQHIEDHVPEHWGIITVEAAPDFYILRKARRNPKDVLRNKLTFLWRPELNRLLEANWLPAYKGKSKDFVRRALLAEVTEDDLHTQIRETLIERDYTTIAEEINAFRAEHGRKPRRKRKHPRKRK